MKATKILRVVTLLGVALIAFPAAAQEGMPEVMTTDGVSYTSGGVGEMERSVMMQHAREYNLRLTFAARSGEYLADVKVSIRDAKGRTVLDAVSDGPWFYAKLAPGKYKVVAEANGKAVTRSVSVGKGKSAAAVMVWKE